MKRFLLVAIAILLLAPPLAEAGAATVRYVGGAYVPGTFRGACLGGNSDLAAPGISGVCELRITPGERRVTVRDDVLGLRAFYWQLSPTGVAPFCRDGEVSTGELLLVVTPACNELSVYVQAGSTTGVVRVE